MPPSPVTSADPLVGVTLNTSLCPPPPHDDTGPDVTSWTLVVPAVTLIIFNVVVIAGNLLVIVAVFTSRKLRGPVTNTYIVSLAFSDLLLGVLVLPFSSANEVLRYWAFGDLWCSVWLAVDVWLSTASILNLCAISLDRFLAVSKPFKYPSLMSPLKARLLVGAVWAVSFLICFPPLIGWNERGEGLAEAIHDGADHTQQPGTQHHSAVNLTNILLHAASSSSSSVPPLLQYSPQYQIVQYNLTRVELLMSNESSLLLCPPADPLPPPPQCVLTSEPGYIIYSACGSFWLPVWVMVFFYWRIYRTAVRTTTAVTRGVLTTKSRRSNGATNNNTDSTVTLRIHRGGSKKPAPGPHSSHNGDRFLSPTTDGGGTSRQSSVRSSRSSTRWRSNTSLLVDDVGGSSHRRAHSCRMVSRGPTGGGVGSTVHRAGGGGGSREPRVRITFNKRPCRFTMAAAPEEQDGGGHDSLERTPSAPVNPGGGGGGGGGRGIRHSGSVNSEMGNGTMSRIGGGGCGVQEKDCDGLSVGGGGVEEDDEVSDVGSRHHTGSASILNKVGRSINIKSHLKRINKEKKAAKTVGIIVGGFIVCWAPFFSVYLLGAFCPDCTPMTVFTVFFWLGYCNSAINPFVYALFSKDFRYAFTKLLRCRCERGGRRDGGRGFGGGRRGGGATDRSRFTSLLNSFKVQISSKDSNSNSD